MRSPPGSGEPGTVLMLELPRHCGNKEPAASLQEIPLSAASASQDGSWRDGCKQEKVLPPLVPPSLTP